MTTLGADGLRRWDGMAVEVEVAEFLYTLVRLHRPQLVVESGSGRGMASKYIAEALRDNGTGRLITFEPHPEFRAIATARLAGFPAEVRDGDSRDLQPDDPNPDFLFLDSGPDYRAQEIEYWLQQPAPCGRVLTAVHDANRDYGLPEGVRFTLGDGLWLGYTL